MDLLRKYLLTNVYRSPDDSGAVQTTTDGLPVPVDPDVSVVELPVGTDDKLSLTKAARTLAKARRQGQQKQPASTAAVTNGAALAQQGESQQERGEPQQTAQ